MGQSTSMSSKRTDYSFKEEYFNQKLQDIKNGYVKKIKVLQQKIRRKDSKNISLKTILNSLRKNNMLRTEELQILQDIGGPNSKIIQRQLQKSRGKSVNKQFDN